MTLIDKAEALAAIEAWFAETRSFAPPSLLEAIAAIPARGMGVKQDRDTFDAMCSMRNSINEHVPMPSLESDLLQGPENSVFCATVAEAVIKEVTRLRSMTNGARVKRLEWHNFDAWTHWAEGACGTYHVEERNGYWQVELRVGGLVHGVTQTDDTTPADLDAAKAAAQRDYEARILASLTTEAVRCAECDCDDGNCTWIKMHIEPDAPTDAAQAQPAMRLETVSENIARDMVEGRFPARSEPQMVPAEHAAHVNETPKSEHDAGHVLTDAAQAREAALREAIKACDYVFDTATETGVAVGAHECRTKIKALMEAKP